MKLLYGLFALILVSSVVTSAIYRANAADYKAQLITLQASYSQAADKAREDAQAQEAKDTAALKLQSSQAIQQATYAKNQAQLTAATYRNKLAQLAGKPNLDLGHQCANTPIPADLVP